MTRMAIKIWHFSPVTDAFNFHYAKHYPTQRNPWMDPTHDQLCTGASPFGMECDP